MRHTLLLFPLLLVAGCAEATRNTAVLEPTAAKHEQLPGPKMSGDLSSALVSAQKDSALTIRIALDARDLPKPPRPGLNVALCIDTSGSMEGKAIEDARKAALAFVESLKPGDWVSVVTFDSKANVLVPASQIDEAGRAIIRGKISAMKAEGTTAMTAGLQAAVQQVRTHYDPSKVNRVVLLGDGVPNEEPGVKAIAQQSASSQIPITTLGLGPDYDEILMGAIATTTQGRFRHIEDSSTLATFFSDELSRISRAVARNGYIDITPGPGVTIDGVIGHEIARVGPTVRVMTGDISLGDRREIFVKIHATPHKDGSAVELADATFHYDDGITQREDHVFVGAHASSDEAKVTASRDATVAEGASKAQAAADEIEAIKKARETDRPKTQQPVKSSKVGGAGGAPVPSAAPIDAKPRYDEAMRTLMQ